MGSVTRQVFIPKPQPYDPDAAVIDCVYVIDNEDRVERARLLIEEANALLFGEHGVSPNHAEVDRQRALLFEKPIEDLCTRMIDLARDDWPQCVEYIGAITLEYQRRMDSASYFASSNQNVVVRL